MDPQPPVLLVIFFNLAFGIRYSIGTALGAGLLKDSFSAGVFGVHTFSFMVCAYLTAVLRQYIYHAGSPLSLATLVFLICLLNIFIHYLLRLMLGAAYLLGSVQFIFIPEIILTVLLANITFRHLKKCVLKFYV